MEYPNCRKLWTEEEEATLVLLAKADTELLSVCEELGRTPMGVILRLRQLSGLERPYPKDMIPPEFRDSRLSDKEKHKEHGRRWSDMDDERLQKDFQNGKTIIELAKDLNRSQTAVLDRIEHLYPTLAHQKVLYKRAKMLLGMKRLN